LILAFCFDTPDIVINFRKFCWWWRRLINLESKTNNGKIPLVVVGPYSG
jgi:hypothetical protein